MILALDPAIKTGWALFDKRGLPVDGGVIDLKGPNRAARGRSLWRFMRDTLRRRGTAKVAIEAPGRYQSMAVTRHAHHLAALVEHYCETYCVPFAEVAPSELKKHATDSGKASKEEMTAAAYLRWGVAPVDDNHADALLVAAWALDCVDWGE